MNIKYPFDLSIILSFERFFYISRECKIKSSYQGIIVNISKYSINSGVVFRLVSISKGSNYIKLVSRNSSYITFVNPYQKKQIVCKSNLHSKVTFNNLNKTVNYDFFVTLNLQLS